MKRFWTTIITVDKTNSVIQYWNGRYKDMLYWRWLCWRSHMQCHRIKVSKHSGDRCRSQHWTYITMELRQIAHIRSKSYHLLFFLSLKFFQSYLKYFGTTFYTKRLTKLFICMHTGIFIIIQYPWNNNHFRVDTFQQ